MILGLDTSATQCAVALVDGDRSWSRTERMARGHAEALVPMIEAVLRDAGATKQDLTRIAVCTGPGSFTGIRAGVAAARGLALGLGVPAVGVSRLEALAEGRPGTVAVPLRGNTWAVQDFAATGPASAPRLEDRPDAADQADALLPDPVAIARLGAVSEPGTRPAPLYLRPADAAPSAEEPVRILGP